MKETLMRIASHRHTSGAALLYVIGMLMESIGPIWFPENKIQIEATAKQIREIATTYGFLFAGDGLAKQLRKKTTGKKMKTSKFLTISLFATLTFALMSCAKFNSQTHQQTKTTFALSETGKTNAIIVEDSVHTVLKGSTLFDANNSMAKAANHVTSKTSGTSLTGLQESSSASNVVSLAEKISAAVTGAAIQAAK